MNPLPGLGRRLHPYPLGGRQLMRQHETCALPLLQAGPIHRVHQFETRSK